MTRRYAIADFLTEEQKRQALNAEYRPWPNVQGWVLHLHPGLILRRDPVGYCPLGRALATEVATPTSLGVARAVCSLEDMDTDRYFEAMQAATDFIHDWDGNQLPTEELGSALGLEEGTDAPR